VVTGNARRGAEIFASDLIRALADQPVDQRVAMLQEPTDGGVEYDASTRVLGVSRAGSLNRRGATLVRRLRRETHSFRPDVVQAHGGDPFKFAALAGLNPPIVYRKIGTAPRWAGSGPRLKIQRFLMKRATKVIGVAESVSKETIALFGMPEERVTTIPNAVDPARIAPSRSRAETRGALGIPEDALVLLSLAALAPEKDPLLHVDTGAAAIASDGRVRHLIVGDGPMRAEVEERVRRSGLGAKTLVLGSRSDVGDLLAASDVLVVASRRRGMEGMPAVVIEAGMAALPVVTFDVAGIHEVVMDGETGRVVPAESPAKLVRAVVDILADEPTPVTMGRAARERCMDRFGIHEIAHRYLSLYREVARP
jgi:glycosyltransferase involved in cell wall biosynthesis